MIEVITCIPCHELGLCYVWKCPIFIHYYYNTKFSFVYSSYIIIQKCWKNSPDDRLTFDTLSTMFNAKIQAIAISSETDMDLEPPSEGIIYYNLEC